MNNDIETIISDNISLKKLVQSNRIQIERADKLKAVLEEEKEELED